jgi:hypothetical protein
MIFLPELQLDADNFACVWSKDLVTGVPLLCVAGTNAKIKIINALTGKLHRVGDFTSFPATTVNNYHQTLAGHGGVR